VGRARRRSAIVRPARATAALATCARRRSSPAPTRGPPSAAHGVRSAGATTTASASRAAVARSASMRLVPACLSVSKEDPASPIHNARQGCHASGAAAPDRSHWARCATSISTARSMHTANRRIRPPVPAGPGRASARPRPARRATTGTSSVVGAAPPAARRVVALVSARSRRPTLQGLPQGRPRRAAVAPSDRTSRAEPVLASSRRAPHAGRMSRADRAARVSTVRAVRTPSAVTDEASSGSARR
jgi:hypothetical protein